MWLRLSFQLLRSLTILLICAPTGPMGRRAGCGLRLPPLLVCSAPLPLSPLLADLDDPESRNLFLASLAEHPSFPEEQARSGPGVSHLLAGSAPTRR